MRAYANLLNTQNAKTPLRKGLTYERTPLRRIESEDDEPDDYDGFPSDLFRGFHPPPEIQSRRAAG